MEVLVFLAFYFKRQLTIGVVYSILIPRGPTHIVQHREWSSTGSPPFTNFLSNQANLIGREYETGGDEAGPPSVFVFYVCAYVFSVCLVSPNSTEDKQHNGQAFCILR